MTNMEMFSIDKKDDDIDDEEERKKERKEENEKTMTATRTVKKCL